MTGREFNEGLQRHLMRCELQYRAENAPKGSEVDWLAPHCGTVQEIARFLPGAWIQNQGNIGLFRLCGDKVPLGSYDKRNRCLRK